jgi:hypothetical protein
LIANSFGICRIIPVLAAFRVLGLAEIEI